MRKTFTADGESNPHYSGEQTTAGLRGDIGGGTAALQVSPTGKDGSWETAKGGDGTDLSFTSADETFVLFGRGLFYRWSLSDAVDPDLDAFLIG